MQRRLLIVKLRLEVDPAGIRSVVRYLGRDEALRCRRQEPIRIYAARELARRRDQLVNGGKALRRLSARQWHLLRLRAKRMRYAMEFFAGTVGRKHEKRHGKAPSALKDLQDSLGALNDVATRESLASHIAWDPKGSRRSVETGEAFAAGLVFGTEESRVEQLIGAAQSAYGAFAT